MPDPDLREFPIRAKLPHIFRVRGQWRVFGLPLLYIFDDVYRTRLEKAHAHARVLSGLVPVAYPLWDNRQRGPHHGDGHIRKH